MILIGSIVLVHGQPCRVVEKRLQITPPATFATVERTDGSTVEVPLDACEPTPWLAVGREVGR